MMESDFVITFDVDWFSDPILEDVTQILVEHNVKATWFITHDSPAIQKIIKNKTLFEVGYHPNFMKGSSQGATEKEVMDYLMGIFSEGISMRTHGLFQNHKVRRWLEGALATLLHYWTSEFGGSFSFVFIRGSAYSSFIIGHFELQFAAFRGRICGLVVGRFVFAAKDSRTLFRDRRCGARRCQRSDLC